MLDKDTSYGLCFLFPFVLPLLYFSGGGVDSVCHRELCAAGRKQSNMKISSLQNIIMLIHVMGRLSPLHLDSYRIGSRPTWKPTVCLVRCLPPEWFCPWVCPA